MNVSELIMALQALDPDAIVATEGCDCSCQDIWVQNGADAEAATKRWVLQLSATARNGEPLVWLRRKD